MKLCIKHPYFGKAMYLVLLSVSLPYGIMMFVYRFSHTGKVCSGDYLENKSGVSVYLVSEGLFFYVLCWIQIIFCECVCCAISCMCCGLVNKDKLNEWVKLLNQIIFEINSI